MEILNQNLNNIDFSVCAPEEYYANCDFNHCNFAQTCLPPSVFENCTFHTCDFSLVKMKNTSWHGVTFKDCKLLGSDFSASNPFSSFSFERCLMNYANFHGMKIKQTRFLECDMIESYFSEADLEGSTFTQCNLNRALFHHTNLMKVDFSSAYNMAIVPANNKLKGAIFSRFNLHGLVAHLDIKLKD